MSRTDTDAVRALLAAHDPAASIHADPANRELSRVEVIASGHRRWRVSHLAPRRPVFRIALGAAAALAALAVVGPFAFPSPRPAYAGPPPAPLEVASVDLEQGREPLLALAETAEGQPAHPRAGDVAYVRTSQWTLTYSQDLDTDEAGWGVLPVRDEVWRTPHESGLQIETPSVPDHLGGDPNPVRRLFEDGPTEWEWGGGEGGDGMFFSLEPGSLSEDPGVLADQLIGEGAVDLPDAEDGTKILYVLQQLYGEAPVEPGVQAAVLRVLAEEEDVMFAGTARDREGREGLLFVAEEDTGDGLLLERRIMFDAGTGQPLYHETLTVESPSEPDTELPRVNNYTVLAESAWVAEIGDTP
ncbi:CU044_5270 family protein [Nocardiopsis sp. CT-R113]|uniref:CU044_5270 family protein n=1 Tax=Nocardiopsis codii TaxID=3065942 RepID=A0ABU7KGG4_9ACTN|nr:CU044_5270 family protein [Nocardiopsis sp. CT-R113]MEE2041326.1 CU044_5270 family protein [Nocardiopsis sp. CT-R113]